MGSSQDFATTDDDAHEGVRPEAEAKRWSIAVAQYDVAHSLIGVGDGLVLLRHGYVPVLFKPGCGPVLLGAANDPPADGAHASTTDDSQASGNSTK